MRLKYSKSILIAVVLLNLLVILYFWRQNSGSLLKGSNADILLAAGRASGLILVFLILSQLFLMGRARPLERVWGLDRLSRIHHWNGVLALVFLFAHPILIASSLALYEKINFFRSLLLFLQNDDVLAAFFGLVILLAVIFVSTAVIIFRWRYEFFYFLHLTVYLAILLVFSHQMELGGDFGAQPLFRAYWILLYTAVIGQLLFYRFARPLWLSWRYRFRVKEVNAESPESVSIIISGRDTGSFRSIPGQFMIYRFFAPRLWWQAHPFTISGRPDGDIRLTVKAVGDYTRDIQKLKPGTSVLLEGPYGVFTAREPLKDKYLLIAGGIGITPLFSLAEFLTVKRKDVILVYGNRTKSAIVFRSVLDRMAKQRENLRVNYILSEEKRPGYANGYVDLDKITKFAPDYHEREIYLCGPVPMMNKLIAELGKNGVKKKRLHYEKFSLN